MDRETELAVIRRAYAKQVMAPFNLTHPRVEAAFAAVLDSGGAAKVTRLYRRDDVPEADCWLHGRGWCLAYR